MRALVFLLILANLLFFVWTQGYFGAPANPDAIRLQQQLLADQISIVARGEPPPARTAKVEKPAEKPAEKPVENLLESACLQWADLTVADADRLERLLSEKFPAFKASRSAVTRSASYWVFIPPSANRQAAEKKGEELKRLGVPEFFIVQDAGPTHLAISLGIFSSLEAANERHGALRALGVRSARVGERNLKAALTLVVANGPGSDTGALREAAISLLPEARPADCKAPAQ
jgi:hypothetical protein